MLLLLTIPAVKGVADLPTRPHCVGDTCIEGYSPAHMLKMHNHPHKYLVTRYCCVTVQYHSQGSLVGSDKPLLHTLSLSLGLQVLEPK